LTHKQGYVISDEDVTEGIGAIGAPLWTSRNHGFAGALSIAGLAEEFTSRRAELVDSLLDTAKTLSGTLP
jgi:IclR family transcriptional regulator, acetate operon repressor